MIVLYADPRLDCNYGQLEKAIVCRSLDQMNCILQTEQPLSQDFEELPYTKLLPLELAVGWPSGIQKLLDVGFSANGALRLSIYMDDLISTRILLAADNFLGDSISGWIEILCGVRPSRNQEMQQVVAQALKQRRQSLAELAIIELPEDEYLGLGLLNEKTLHVAALNVYRRLKERGVNVPPELNLASACPIWKDHRSVYHSLLRYGHLSSLELLDSFFENGFESVDTSNEKGETPLLLVCANSAGGIAKKNGYTFDALAS